MVSTIKFKFFAPRNRGVALIDSFYKWQQIPMEKDEKGYFRTVVELKDRVYEYKLSVKTKIPQFELDQ